MTLAIIQSDALSFLGHLPTGCASLTMFSPPYEDARTYGIGFTLQSQDWVNWLAPIVAECCRVTDGLVCVVMAGKVKHFQYSPVVEWLVADLTRKYGLVCGPAPYVFHRVGIPGSGSKHYHRRDWEPVYAFARPECLPVKWSDNTAMGHPPKWAPGGAMSHRLSNGDRKGAVGNGSRRERGESRRLAVASGLGRKITAIDSGEFADKETRTEWNYVPPKIANPGNVIHCKVGGNLMGHPLAHENEAPYPEKLVEFFVRSFAPPQGIVIDPFVGSGTTAAVALKHGRRFVGCDVRQSQVAIALQRCASITQPERIAAS